MGRHDMAEEPRLANNRGRVEHEREIDAAIAAWTEQLDSTEALQRLAEARVPSGAIYSVADMFEDPHFRARGLFEEVERRVVRNPGAGAEAQRDAGPHRLARRRWRRAQPRDLPGFAGHRRGDAGRLARTAYPVAQRLKLEQRVTGSPFR